MNLQQMKDFEQEVSPEVLIKKGFLKKTDKLKILAKGKLDQSLKVKAHKFSKAAKQEIEKAGGKAEVI